MSSGEDRVQAVIEVVEGRAAGRRFHIRTSDELRIGRSNQAEIPIDDPRASRIHCVLVASGGNYVLRDMYSRNGTLVNEEPLAGSIALTHGDKIRIGRTVLLLSVPEPKVDTPVIVGLDLDEWLESSPSVFCSSCSAPIGDVQPEGQALCGVCAALVEESARSTVQEPSSETQRIGIYEVHEALGSGRTGVVYRARDTREERWVALKVLRPESTAPEVMQRFDEGLRGVRDLRHPGINAYLDSGSTAEVLFLATEYCEGEDLHALLRQRGTVEQHEATRWVCQILEALEYAHAQSAIHADIKPANVILTDGDTKLLDFGLARIVERSGMRMTSSWIAVGSLGYLPPERMTDARRPDHRADLYSAGVVLFNLLTGDLPHPAAGNLLTQMSNVLRGQRRRMRQVVPGIDPTLDEIVYRATAPEPTERFESATAMLEALRAV